MDRLDSMALLIAAVESGSLSAAGRRLDVPLATVSRRISELEAHLKTRLLHRSTRKLSLTDAGASYVAACRRILEEVGEAERAASGEYSAPRGNLIITAPIVFGRLHVLPVATAFLKVYPEVDLRLDLSDHVSNLLEQHIDLAVRIGMLPDSSLIATRVGLIQRVICASPTYLRKRGKPKRPQDLERHDCVAFEGLTSPLRWSFGIGNAENSVAIRSRLVVSTAEAAIDAAIGGLGLTAVLSYQVADAMAAGRLVPVLQDFAPAALPVSLVYAGGGRMPLKLRAFLDFAVPRLRARLNATKN